MPFQSPLHALLRLRSSLERVAWLRLRTVHARIGAARMEVRKLEEQVRVLRVDTSARLRVGMEGAELTIDSVNALEWQRTRTLELLDGLERQRNVAEREFMKRRREREIVENALALGRARYEEERGRREQAQIDDGILQRINRERETVADES